MSAWLAGAEFNELVRAFHERHARYPPRDQMRPAKRHLNEIIDRLQRNIDVATRIEFTGSSYEDIKVMSSDLEFDCMVMLKGGPHLGKVTQEMPLGYSKLRVLPGKENWFPKCTDNQNYLSSELVSGWFFSKLQKAVNDLRINDYEIKLRRHGPATQMDIYNLRTSKLWYSVDVVPAYEIRGQEIYVAKPYKEVEDENEVYTTWRRSFSLEEKAIMKSLDQGNKCRKMCIRMLKVIRERESTLRKLPSYFIKTTVLNMVKRETWKSWDHSQIGRRFVEILSNLKGYLESGNLPHRFLPRMNIMCDFDEPTRYNMASRIEKWLKSEKEMRKLLS